MEEYIQLIVSVTSLALHWTYETKYYINIHVSKKHRLVNKSAVCEIAMGKPTQSIMFDKEANFVAKEVRSQDAARVN